MWTARHKDSGREPLERQRLLMADAFDGLPVLDGKIVADLRDIQRFDENSEGNGVSRNARKGIGGKVWGARRRGVVQLAPRADRMGAARFRSTSSDKQASDMIDLSIPLAVNPWNVYQEFRPAGIPSRA